MRRISFSKIVAKQDGLDQPGGEEGVQRHRQMLIEFRHAFP